MLNSCLDYIPKTAVLYSNQDLSRAGFRDRHTIFQLDTVIGSWTSNPEGFLEWHFALPTAISVLRRAFDGLWFVIMESQRGHNLVM